MIHRVHSNTVAELNRVLESIQKRLAPSESTRTAASQSGGEGSVGAGTVQGPKGDTGAAGADGSTANLLVGAEHAIEILMAPNGDVLTDENGYALLGVKVYSTIVTGAGTTDIEALNVT